MKSVMIKFFPYRMLPMFSHVVLDILYQIRQVLSISDLVYIYWTTDCAIPI